jgi:hypothetical protein
MRPHWTWAVGAVSAVALAMFWKELPAMRRYLKIARM